MEIVGTIKKIGVTEEKASGFKVRDLLVTVTDGKFPADVPVDFTQDKVELLNKFNVGEEVTVSINLGSYEATSSLTKVKRHMPKITGWKVSLVNDAPLKETAADMTIPADQENDELPF
jgi:single-strand DNA-binding protein